MLTIGEQSILYKYIQQNTTEASRFEMLAEECMELAHVAQKIARYLRNEQPVSKDFDLKAAMDNLVEEGSDVNLAFECAITVDNPEAKSIWDDVDVDKDVFYKSDEIYNAKLVRLVERLKERKEKEETAND